MNERLEPSAHKLDADELRRLPSILRLGAGDETSLATKLMRAAASEIETLRAAPEDTRLREAATELREAASNTVLVCRGQTAREGERLCLVCAAPWQGHHNLKDCVIADLNRAVKAFDRAALRRTEERDREPPRVGAWGEMIADILLKIGEKTSDEEMALTLARLAGKIRAQCDSRRDNAPR